MTLSSVMEQNSVLPIDKGWAWIIMFANLMIAFLVIGSTTSFGIFFTAFMEEFNASASNITVALAIQTVTLSVTSLLVLSIGTCLTTNRTFIILGGVMACLAYVVSALIQDIRLLILSHGLIFGMAYGFSYGPSLVVLGQYFHTKRGLASSLSNIGVSLGSLSFPPIIRLLLDTYGLRGALIVIGGILLNITVAGALMRPLTFYDKKGIPNGKSNNIWTTKTDVTDSSKEGKLYDNKDTIQQVTSCDKDKQIVTVEKKSYDKKTLVSPIINKIKKCFRFKNLNISQKSKPSALRKIINFSVLNNILFRIWIPACFLGIIGCTQIVIFIPPHAKDLHINDIDATILVMIVGGANFASKILLAFLTYHNILPKHFMMAISLAVTGVAGCAIPLYTDFWGMCVLSAIFGIFGGVYFALFPAVLVDFVGLKQLSSAMAITLLMHGLGLSISNPLLGYIRDRTGSFHGSFYLMGATLIFSGSVLLCEPVFRRLENKRTERTQEKSGITFTITCKR